MKKNKILAVVLSAAIAISLTGCGNSGGKDADSGTANSGSAGSGSEELKDTGKKEGESAAGYKIGLTSRCSRLKILFWKGWTQLSLTQSPRRH